MACPRCGKPIRECFILEGKECFDPVYFRVKCQMVAEGKDVEPKHRCYLATVNETKLRINKQ